MGSDNITIHGIPRDDEWACDLEDMGNAFPEMVAVFRWMVGMVESLGNGGGASERRTFAAM